MVARLGGLLLLAALFVGLASIAGYAPSAHAQSEYASIEFASVAALPDPATCVYCGLTVAILGCGWRSNRRSKVPPASLEP